MATRKVTKVIEVEEEVKDRKYILKYYAEGGWSSGDGDFQDVIYDNLEDARTAAEEAFNNDSEITKVEIYELPEKPVVVGERKITFTDVV